jgi:2'-5' RNA ligase
MTDARRLFIAIDLPKAVCFELARLVAEPPRGVRPTPVAQLHLTLHFLGDVDDAVRAAVVAGLGRVRREPFSIAIRGTGVFPPRGRPSVLWAGVAPSTALLDLHAAVGGQVEASGLAIESRPYVPHVTLARLLPGAPRGWLEGVLAQTRSLAIDAIPVARFHLYCSRRIDGRTEHTAEATFPLG